MPIDESEWNTGKVENGLKDAIIDHLNRGSTQAFTAMEVLDQVKQFSGEPWGGFLTGLGSLRPIQEALKELEVEGQVES